MLKIWIKDRVNRYSRARAIRKALNYPIFIPEQDSDIVDLIVRGDADKIPEILMRRASLGSGSAAAFLGYLELMGAFSDEPNPDAAIAFCSTAAKEGNSYAQFILSYAYWECQKWDEALRWMMRAAADIEFLPGGFGLGAMLSISAKSRAGQVQAVKILWLSHKRGYGGALALICASALCGYLGPLARPLGFLVFPYALIRSVAITTFDPYGTRSFFVHRMPKLAFRRLQRPGS